jgi:signal transduction histidine kinase
MEAAELRLQLAARDKTIAKLVERVEGLQARPVSSFTLLTQTISLEELVRNRTAELDDQRRTLERALHELQQTQARLLQAQKLEAIGQLAAGIAHEINTPIQFVSDNLAFIENAVDRLFAVVLSCQAAVDPEHPDAADAADAAARARDAMKKAKLDYLAKQLPRAVGQSVEGVRRVGHLVAALKEFSHPSAGNKVEADVNALLETVLTISHNEYKYVATLTRDLAPNLPPLPCLRDELSQVILNLIVNAAHAVAARPRDPPALGHITVRTRAVGDDVEIEVEDDGCGIPLEIRHRIFEPFFTTKPVGKGTGQGLAIAYDAVVDKHGGRLEVESEVGVGSTFTISLPVGGATPGA